MKIGLFFGSFNPIHNGHLRIATEAYEQLGLDSVWFVVSPKNPHKDDKDLMPLELRIKLIDDALGMRWSNSNEIINRPHFGELRAVDLESELPAPYYTSETLRQIYDQLLNESGIDNPELTLIMGEDSVSSLHLWHDYKFIVENFKIAYYPRQDCGQFLIVDEAMNDELKLKGLVKLKAPLIDISSTQIRNKVKNNLAINFLVPDHVIGYIQKTGYYK